MSEFIVLGYVTYSCRFVFFFTERVCLIENNVNHHPIENNKMERTSPVCLFLKEDPLFVSFLPYP